MLAVILPRVKYNKPLGQEVHFRKRLKTFKPLGSTNGDGAGEGKTRGKGETCKGESCEFLKKIGKLGLLECISSFLEQKLEGLYRIQTSHLFCKSTRIPYLNWGNFQRN